MIHFNTIFYTNKLEKKKTMIIQMIILQTYLKT